MYCIIRFGMYAASIVLTAFGHTAALSYQDTNAFPSLPPSSDTSNVLYIEQWPSPKEYTSEEPSSPHLHVSQIFECEELTDSSDSHCSYNNSDNDNEKLHAGTKRTHSHISTSKPLAVTVIDNVSKLAASARNDPGPLTPYEDLLNLNTLCSSQNFKDVQPNKPYLTVWNNAFSGARYTPASFHNTGEQQQSYSRESTERIIAYAKCEEIKTHLAKHACTADQFMALIEKRNFHPKSIGAFAKRLNNNASLLTAILSKIKQLPETKGYKKDEYCKAITQAMKKEKVVITSTEKTLSNISKDVAAGKCSEDILTQYETAQASPSSFAQLISTLKDAIQNGAVSRTRIDQLIAYYKKPENKLKNNDWFHSLIKISSFAQNPQTQEEIRDIIEAVSPADIHILLKKSLPLPADFFNLFEAKKSPTNNRPYDQKFFCQYARLIKMHQAAETCSAMVNHLESNPCVSDEITKQIIDILKSENTSSKKK